MLRLQQFEYHPRRSGWLFTIVFVIACLLYNYPHTMQFGPRGIHQWRQSDCYSIAVNYYEENRPFLQPAMHWCTEDGVSAQAVSEMPLLNYSVAMLWKIFGKHDWIYRMLETLILFLGLFALFRIFEDLTKNSIWALLLTQLVFTSPLLAYYGNSFTPDVPAFSVALMGLYAFLKQYRTGQRKWIIAAYTLFLIAGLLKISSLLIFFSIGGIFVLERLKWLKTEAPVFKMPWWHAGGFLVVIAVTYFWYSYATRYNEAHGSGGLLLTGILPFWDITDPKAPTYIARALFQELMREYFNLPILCILLCLAFGLLLNFRRNNRALSFMVLFGLIGMALFIVLFFQVFNVHDYYLTNMLMLAVLILGAAAAFMHKQYPAVLQARTLRWMVLLLIVFSTWHTAIHTRLKYSYIDPLVMNSWMVSGDEYERMHGLHTGYELHLNNCHNITPTLRKLGIKREDKVISIPDGSINVSLALMDQKGFSEFGYSDRSGTDRIEHFIKLGAKYLVVNDLYITNEEWLKPFLGHRMGDHDLARIYDLRPYADSIKKKP